MPVADTTVLVALLDPSHPRHQYAMRLLAGVPVLHVPTVVVAELALVVRRLARDSGHNGDAYARKAIAALMGKPEVREHQTHDGEEARRLYAADKGLSYVDAVCVVTAWDLAAKLVSFDRRQLLAWRRRMPE